MAFCRNFGKKRNKNEERHPKLIVALTTQAENGNADARCRLTNPQNSIIMPRIKKQVHYLRTEKFNNRWYKIEINYFDHGMAEVSVHKKPRGSFLKRWLRDDHLSPSFAYIPFDECKVESIYDYMDALKVLDGDKVARRWFIRKMRHCTDGLVGLDGKIDMEHIEQVENDQFHRTKISVEALSEEQKDILLDTCPEAAYEEEFRSASFMEQMPPEKPMKKLPPHVKRPKPSCKIIVRSCKGTLALIQKILPDFYEEASRKRTLDNCTVNVNIIYCEPNQWHLNACIIDNDYVLYSKHAQT